MSRRPVIEAWLQDVVFAGSREDGPGPKRRRARSPTPRSPAKRRCLLQPKPANMPPLRSHDVDKTPKPARRSSPRRHPVESFALPSASYATELAAASQYPTLRPFTSSQSSSSPTQSKRSASPTKGVADLRFNKSFRTLGLSQLQDGDLTDGMDELFEALVDIGHCEGIIPAMVKSDVAKLPWIMRLQFRDYIYASADVDSRSEFDVRREFCDVRDLVQRSEEYQASKQYSEAAWNDAVHSRVLEIALRELPGVNWHNITTARIFPYSLVPQHNLGSDFERRMVDYAITLVPPASLEQTLSSALDIESIATGIAQPQTVNHTAYPPLRLTPIWVSIETKAPDGNQSEAMAQLAI